MKRYTTILLNRRFGKAVLLETDDFRAAREAARDAEPGERVYIRRNCNGNVAEGPDWKFRRK